jgi:hypothetical protein
MSNPTPVDPAKSAAVEADAVESIVPLMPLVLPIAGGVLMLLTAGCGCGGHCTDRRRSRIATPASGCAIPSLPRRETFFPTDLGGPRPLSPVRKDDFST